MRIPMATLLTGGLLFAALLTFTFTARVRFSEVAVKVRLGKADASSIIREPGIYFKWPWPIEQVVPYDKRLQVLDTPEGEIKTQDGKNLIVGLYALWRIQDPLQFYVRVQDIRRAEEQLRSRLNEFRAAVIGKHDLSEFLGLDEQQVTANHAAIEKQMLDAAAPRLLADYGVELVAVGIRRISLHNTVNDAVFNSMQQEREAEATRYREEGRSVAAGIVARAEGAARIIREFATARGAEIERAGKEAESRILAQIKPEDRDFFIWLRWLDALRASLKEKSTIFFDANSELFRVLDQPAAFAPPTPAPPAMFGGEDAARGADGHE
ncbi:MAG: protease modulator HflC [Phycisphaerae bacterium]